MSKLDLQPREVLGKKVKQLRNSGILPVTVYSPGMKSLSLQTNSKEFGKVFKQDGFSALIDATVAGEKEKILIKEVQIHPTKDTILSASFYLTDSKTAITADIPVTYVGTSKAEELGEGFIVYQVEAIAVRCLPADLPSHIELDLALLAEAGAVITVGDIELPKGVELDSKMEATTAIAYVATAQKREAGETAEDNPEDEGTEAKDEQSN